MLNKRVKEEGCPTIWYKPLSFRSKFLIILLVTIWNPKIESVVVTTQRAHSLHINVVVLWRMPG